MSRYTTIKAGIAIFWWLASSSVMSQGVQSAYSIQGVGELVSPGLVSNISMGGLGISAGSSWTLNNMNPALLARNNFTSFDMSFSANFKTVATEQSSQKLSGGALNYVILGIPIMPGRWTLAGGLQRYSHVRFNLVAVDSLSDDNLLVGTSFEGSGGLNEFYISNGFRITKSLLLGFTGSYIFGPIENERLIRIQGDNTHTAFVDRISHSDLKLGLGAMFAPRIAKEVYLNLGATYDLGVGLNAKRSQFKEIRVANDVAVVTDTMLFEQKGEVGLPARYGFGFSFEKPNRWLAGIDFALQNWSEYQDFEGNQEILANSYRINVGGEYIPDVSSVTSYLKRMTYRLGVSYKQTPFLWEEKNVNEISVGMGVSFPVPRYSNLNLGAEIGRRGDLSEGQIEERFTRIYLGLSFNDLPWQKRPIYD